MKLGFVTYQIGQDWNLPTIIDMCQKTGFTGVELRTSHAHGVETELGKSEIRNIKKLFRESGVDIVGLGTAFEYHAVDPFEVKKNIEGTLQYANLAADLGCKGIKVRPNGLQIAEGIPEEKTLEQIGNSIGFCAQKCEAIGVEIRVEVHGQGTQDPSRMRTIMDHADHSNARICWNSNFGEVIDGSIGYNYELLRHKISLVHITEIYQSEYPWRELFCLLKGDNYTGYTLAEIGQSKEPERLMGYYKALWEAYQF